MKLLITLLLLFCHNCVRSLPIQSQALENVDDQFFWQQAWFSSNDKPDSPFTSGDSKKITAKSIFITPNLVKPSHYCPPGYLIDDNGKCIKVFAIQQPSEELLTSRLINLISTDNFEYDYDDGEQSTSVEQLNNLPALVPILNENSDEEEKSELTTDKISLFLGDVKKDDVEIVITTLSNDNETVSYEHATVGGENENVTESSTKSSSKDSESSLKVFDSLIKASLSSSESSTEESSQKMNSEESSSPKNQEVSTENSNQSSEENQKEIIESSSLKNEEENLNLSQNKAENFESSTQKAHSESSEGSYENSPMTLEQILYGQFEKFLKESNLESSTQTAESQNVREINETSNFNNSQNNETNSSESSEELFDNLNPQMMSQKISTPKVNSEMSQSEKSTENPFKSTESLLITTASNFNVEIFEQSTDVTISESSDKINLDADNAFLLNESLIIVDDKNNSSDVDYSDAITTLEPFGDFETLKEEEEKVSTTPQDDLEYDRQNENHQLTTTTTTMPAPLSATTEFAKKLLRFPSQRVRFPDDEIITTPRQTSFSWPKESNTPSSGSGVPNKLHITRFWNSQPFISDNSSRGNFKNFRTENFLPYTRKVQILTPPRYNYRK